ncbi:MAG: transaldolase [Bowdeniella nasicola]|nr:transaldolase [Bowdeniella nasicola]
MSNYSKIHAARTSIWLDDLSRAALRDDSDVSLRDDISKRNVVGVTTNPSIFAAALADGKSYRDDIAKLKAAGSTSVEDVAMSLMITDVQRACDVLADVYEESDGKDGRVSLEVDPRLAHDTKGTIQQARMLFKAVDRPNVMVKIPATDAGLPAIRRAISEGISINATLIFSPDRYRAVVDAYIDGLRHAQRNGVNLRNIRSVASVFISRTDSAVDELLDELESQGVSEAADYRGQVGIAVGRTCYGIYEEVFSQPRYRELHKANKQRPLWASTGVKDPAYPPTHYVTNLVGPNTVNTMPRATLNAIGELDDVPRDSIRPAIADANRVLSGVEELGVDLTEIFARLEREGVEKFIASWEDLLAVVAEQMEA